MHDTVEYNTRGRKFPVWTVYVIVPILVALIGAGGYVIGAKDTGGVGQAPNGAGGEGTVGEAGTPPTPTPAPVPATTEEAYLERYISEGGVPKTGTTMDVRVDEGTLHVMTSGPITVAGVRLPGGEGRGSVVIFLPGDTYHVTGLVWRQNWHGAYNGPANLWPELAEDRIAAMFSPDNCGPTACQIVDLLVVGPGGQIVKQETRKRS